MSIRGKPHPKDKFTPSEDERLKLLVKIFGTGSWNKVSENMGKRTSRQCRDRYKNYLDPKLNSGPWTEEEDILLEKLIEKIGKKWSLIAKEFNGRTDINIKSRYMLLQRKKDREKLYNVGINMEIDEIEPPQLSFDMDFGLDFSTDDITTGFI